jgi:hypothetical protein
MSLADAVSVDANGIAIAAIAGIMASFIAELLSTIQISLCLGGVEEHLPGEETSQWFPTRSPASSAATSSAPSTRQLLIRHWGRQNIIGASGSGAIARILRCRTIVSVVDSLFRLLVTVRNMMAIMVFVCKSSARRKCRCDKRENENGFHLPHLFNLLRVAGYCGTTQRISVKQNDYARAHQIMFVS